MKLVLVHLVRRHNGPAPLERFLESYVARPPGVEHDLLLGSSRASTRQRDAEPSLAAARVRGLDPATSTCPMTAWT